MNSPDLLEHKVALVAGGGRGIGAAISHGLAEAGAIVAVIDVDPARAQQVCDEIVAGGGRALAVPTDLLDGEQIDAAVDKTIDEFGQIDVLVNNAGGMYSYVSLKPIHEWTDEEWELISSMNLDYVFRTCRAALKPMMAAGTGSIVNIASTGGINAAPRIAPYGAAKAAVMSLTRSLAVEYGHHGIRVNAVAPGTIETVAAAGQRPNGERQCRRGLDPTRSSRPPRGHRSRRRVPRLPPRRLHHRRDADRRRRHHAALSAPVAGSAHQRVALTSLPT